MKARALLRRLTTTVMLVVLGSSLVQAPISAAAFSSAVPVSGFSIQVSPSPLVTTLKPGQTTDLELKVRNAGTEAENLKIETRSFTINSTTGAVKLGETPPADIAKWITFASPLFSVQPGQVFTEKVHFALPQNTGFSYSFALLINRQKDPQPTTGGRLIKGAVAVFALINVDRPGATRKLGATAFTTSKKFYEYLPATLDIKLKNTGNTIVQPYGNVYVQRGPNTKSPLASLPVNEQQGYILPGVTRTLDMLWNDGFPHYKTNTDGNGKTSKKLIWNWSDMSKFRAGHYTAKLVAVYNDGGHDVPIEGEVSFWVIPWKILLGALLFLLLMLFGLWSLGRKIFTTGRRILGKKPRKNSTPES
jgi:hypothetical protein